MARRASGFIVGLTVFLWLTSLTTQGFVRILHLLVEGYRQAPYLWLTLNIIAVLYVLYYTIKPLVKAYRSISGFWTGFTVGAIVVLYYSLVTATATLAGLVWLIVPLTIKYGGQGYGKGFSVRIIKSSYKGVTSNALFSALVTILLIIGVLLVLYAPVMASREITGVTLTHPYNVYGVNRLIPLYTAYVYASDRIQIPTHTVYKAETYIYYENETPIYNWLIEPEGFWNSVTRKPIGAIFVEGDKYPVNVKLVNSQVKWGLHNMKFKLFYFDSLERKLKLQALGYDIRFDEAVELYRQGQIWIAIPYNTWERGLLWDLRKPAGIILVNSNGTVRKLTLEAAVKSPILKGLPIVSEKTAREWAEKYAYKNGFVAVYFKHNKYEIRDVGENPQPYLEPGDNGTLWWVFAVEPAGNTHSTKYILYINARDPSGKPLIYLWKPSELLIGVSKIMSYVKQAHPNYDWGQVKAVEPLPTITNGSVLWKVSVVTGDYRGLVSIDVINAKSGQDTSFKVEKSITAKVILDEVLNITQVKPGYTNETVLARINNIQQEINETIQKLNDLYSQLEELKSQLNLTSR
ncbi:MAG: hypothetical protein F7B59_06845 [Desulfurococcales archaeon]|nr:hypothetical protein [Desulfurococcales archaeon]